MNAKIAEKPALAKKSNEIQMIGANQCPPLNFTTFATLFLAAAQTCRTILNTLPSFLRTNRHFFKAF
jgi:hypothetical protein